MELEELIQLYKSVEVQKSAVQKIKDTLEWMYRQAEEGALTCCFGGAVTTGRY